MTDVASKVVAWGKHGRLSREAYPEGFRDGGQITVGDYVAASVQQNLGCAAIRRVGKRGAEEEEAKVNVGR